MPRHGVPAPRPVAGAIAVALPAALLAWSLAACADGSGAPTAPARAGAIGEPAAVTAHDVVVDPIRALLLDTFFVAESQKVRDDVDAAWTALHDGKGTDCADAQFLASLTLDRLAAGALGPSYGAPDPATAKRVNGLLAWLAPFCPDVPASLPAVALSPNGLAVPIDPGQAYSLTTRDGVLHFEVRPNTFTRPVILVVTRMAAGPGGGPFATTLPQYGPMFRITTYPAAQRTSGGAIDFAAALVGDRVPPKSAAAQLLPVFGQTPTSPLGTIRAVLGGASTYLVGSPGFMRPPNVSINPKPFISDSSTTSGSTAGSIPTFETTCDETTDCNYYQYASVRDLADVGTASVVGTTAGSAAGSARLGAPSGASAGTLPFDLTVGLARVFDPAVNGRAALDAKHVCGLRYTITNAGNVDLAAIFQPVDRNGASAGGMWRAAVLVPAHGSRAVQITLPRGVPASTVNAFQLMYGPTLVKSVKPGATVCP